MLMYINTFRLRVPQPARLFGVPELATVEAAEGAGSIVTSVNGYAIVPSPRLANERGDDVVIMPEAAAP